ncbi:ceramidase domain-containing protein [Runella sp.]|uniref:ceramidase domain-containing protein n=1 Tax=Runella sp. TaxID=1960881 RepID=UPI003D13FA6B
MEKQTVYKLLIRSFFLTLGMWLIWFGANTFFNGEVWQGMVVSKSALMTEYCEFNNVARFFHQRMNTYSNLAYFFFGVLILQMANEDHKNQGIKKQNRLESFPLLSAFMGLGFVYLSFGSAFFHASLTYIGQRVDMNGTYGITLVLVSITLYHVLHRVTFTPSLKIAWLASFFVIIVLFLKIALLIPSAKLLPSLILVMLIGMVINYFQFRKERLISLVVLSLVLMVVAIKIRTMDVQKMGCNPYSCYQGHSVWHLLTAISSFCSYSFFRFAGTTSNRSMSVSYE